MGQSLSGPITEKFTESGASRDLRYAVSAIQGWRISMEDSHCCCLPFSPQHPDWFYFAVFDGHAGKNASNHCSKFLLSKMRAEYEELSNKPKVIENSEEFVGLDAELSPEIYNLAVSVHESFIRIDDEMKSGIEFKDESLSSGTTALILIVTPTHLVFGNCGDSRGILCRNEEVFFSTKDHKPTDQAEKDRIEKAGASVIIQRVNGNLAVSRAIGDFSFKNKDHLQTIEQAVSPEPTVSVIKRDPLDDFILLACDGVWDVMDNKEVTDYVLDRLEVTDDVLEIVSSLIDACLFRNSRDNMTSLMILFPNAPGIDPETVQKDNEIKKMIENEINKIAENETSELHVYPVMKKLIENLEMLGTNAILSKINFVLDVLNRLNPDRDKSKDFSSPLDNSKTTDFFFQQFSNQYSVSYQNKNER